MVAIKYTGDELWARVERAEQQARNRLDRVVACLDSARIDYVAAGELAVQFWVAITDRTALRNAREVDVVVGANDFDEVKRVLTAGAFVNVPVAGKEFFLDDTGGRVRIYFAAREQGEATPTLTDYQTIFGVRVALLDSLVRMMLSSFTILERVNLHDMLDVSLIDPTWLPRFSGDLQSRLQHLIDTPDG